MDFLRRHGFGFHDLLHAAPLRQLHDVMACVLRRLGPENTAAVFDDGSLELFQVLAEVIDGIPFDLGGDRPGVLPCGVSRFAQRDGGIVGGDVVLEDRAMLGIPGLRGRIAAELDG